MAAGAAAGEAAGGAAAKAVMAAGGVVDTFMLPARAVLASNMAGLPLSAAGPLPSSSCLGAKREGRTDVLSLRASAGLAPALSPAAAAVLPKPPASPPSREAVRGISPLSSALSCGRALIRGARPAAPAATPLLCTGLLVACSCLLGAAKGDAAAGSAMPSSAACCTDPGLQGEVAAAAAAVAAAIASGGRTGYKPAVLGEVTGELACNSDNWYSCVTPEASAVVAAPAKRLCPALSKPGAVSVET